MDNPIWMLLVDWSILVDHFQLHPQAEFHAHIVDTLSQASNTIRQQLLIWCPISQAMIIITAGGEPAIIQDKQLYACFLGLAGNLYQLVLIKVKVGGFPVVDKDRANLVPPYPSGDTFCSPHTSIPKNIAPDFFASVKKQRICESCMVPWLQSVTASSLFNTSLSREI